MATQSNTAPVGDAKCDQGWCLVTANSHAELPGLYAEVTSYLKNPYAFVQGAEFNRQIGATREVTPFGDLSDKASFLPAGGRGEMLNPAVFGTGMADVVLSLAAHPVVAKYLPVPVREAGLSTFAAGRLTPRPGSEDLCGALEKCLRSLGCPRDIIERVNALRDACQRLSEQGAAGLREWPNVVEQVLGVPLSSIDPTAATVLKVFTSSAATRALIDAMDPCHLRAVRWLAHLLNCHLQGSFADAVTGIYVLSGRDPPVGDCSYAERVAHLQVSVDILMAFLNGGSRECIRYVPVFIGDAEYDDNLCSAFVAAVADVWDGPVSQFAILPQGTDDKPVADAYAKALDLCGHHVRVHTTSRNLPKISEMSKRF